SRAYVRGDPISTIDWRASARLSTALGRDEFVVRERYAEEAPRVVVLADRRPAMGVYGAPFPWLSKPEAVRSATELIGRGADGAERAPRRRARARPGGGAVLARAERPRNVAADRGAHRGRARLRRARGRDRARARVPAAVPQRALVGDVRLRDLGLPRRR